MSKGGSRTQTVTQSTEPPFYVQAAQQNLMDAANRITSPFLQSAPAQPVAGFTPDQLRAFEMARGMAEGEIASPAPALPMTSTLWNMRSTPGWTADAVTADPTAGQVSGASITPFLNPYRQDVLDPTIDRMRRERDITQAQIDARGASGAAFGGSRQALQSAEVDRSFGDQVAKVTGDLMMQGYDRATAVALANAQAAQQAGQFNASALNQMAAFNIGQRNQAESENARAWNEMMTSDANRALAAAGLGNTFQNDEQQRQLRALATILGTGGQQQQLAQREADIPVEMLRLLGGATPGTYGGTSSTTQPTQSNPLATVAGLASIGGGLFGPFGIFPGALSGIFSDERDKTDIKKLGRDRETGLDMYAYRYRGDPKDTPKVVGPMAQDIERKYPNAVREIGGHKVVNANMLRAVFGLGA